MRTSFGNKPRVLSQGKGMTLLRRVWPSFMRDIANVLLLPAACNGRGKEIEASAFPSGGLLHFGNVPHQAAAASDVVTRARSAMNRSIRSKSYLTLRPSLMNGIFGRPVILAFSRKAADTPI